MNLSDTIVQRSVDKAQEGVVTLRFGRVKSAANGSIVVLLAGVEVSGVACLSSYIPKPNDWAWLLKQGSLLVAVGCSQGTVNEGDKNE